MTGQTSSWARGRTAGMRRPSRTVGRRRTAAPPAGSDSRHSGHVWCGSSRARSCRRLVLARGRGRNRAVRPGGRQRSPDATDVRELVRLLLAHDVGVASAYVETVRQRGATLDLVCLQLLAPAARELGLLWEEDECDFMQVTVGIVQIAPIAAGASAPNSVARSRSASCTVESCWPRARASSTPLGFRWSANFCSGRAGRFGRSFRLPRQRYWNWSAENWFAVVGLSVGSDLRLEEIATIIRAIRSASATARWAY